MVCSAGAVHGIFYRLVNQRRNYATSRASGSNPQAGHDTVDEFFVGAS